MCHLCGKWCIPTNPQSPIPVRVDFGGPITRLVCWSCYKAIYPNATRKWGTGKTEKPKGEKGKGETVKGKSQKGSSP